jgi:hypothetical protein
MTLPAITTMIEWLRFPERFSENAMPFLLVAFGFTAVLGATCAVGTLALARRT